jgi:hypothetical protein
MEAGEMEVFMVLVEEDLVIQGLPVVLEQGVL